jgi:hypothetical protein
MKLYFVDPKNEQYYKSDIFGNVLRYVQTHSEKL